MSTLYIDEQGSEIKKKGETLLVEKDGSLLAEVPAAAIDRVVIVGNVDITTPALAFFFSKNIPVSFITSYGNYRGRLKPPMHKNAALRLKQYERYKDEEFKVTQSKAVVSAKLDNLKIFLQKHARNNPEKGIDEHTSHIDALSKRLFSAQTISEIMGIEGSASREYFSAFGKLLKGDFIFNGRNRRPPKDPVNAVLSLGYTLLFNEAYSAVEAIGLDPYIGFLHEIDYGRPSLAVDMMEEFRYLIDGLALTLTNKGMLSIADFMEGDNGVYLKEKAREVFYRQYEKRINTEVAYKTLTVNYRRVFIYQAEHLARVIAGEEPCYRGYEFR